MPKRLLKYIYIPSFSFVFSSNATVLLYLSPLSYAADTERPSRLEDHLEKWFQVTFEPYSERIPPNKQIRFEVMHVTIPRERFAKADEMRQKTKDFLRERDEQTHRVYC